MPDIVEVVALGEVRTGKHNNVYHFELSPNVSGADLGLLGLDLWNKVASIYNQVKPHMETLWKVTGIIVRLYDAVGDDFVYLTEYTAPSAIVGENATGARSSWTSQQIWLDVAGTSRNAQKRISAFGEGIVSANALDAVAVTSFVNAAASWYAPLTMANTGLAIASGMFSKTNKTWHAATGVLGVNAFLGTQGSRKVGVGE